MLLRGSTLLLVYPDLLGDFFLFSPHLVALRHILERRFDDIIWTCQPAVVPLVEHLKDQLPGNLSVRPITDFPGLTVTPKKLLKWPLIAHKARQITRQMQLPSPVAEIWCPSLAPWVSNGIVASVKSPLKLGRHLQSRGLQWIQNRLYTELYRPDDFAQFVFYQHHGFFQQALDMPYPMPELRLAAWQTLSQQTIDSRIDRPYRVIVPDSANVIKEWPLGQQVRLIDQLVREFPTEQIVLVGANPHHGAYLKAHLSDYADNAVINLIGRTSLLEAITLMAQATQVICPDSFALHATSIVGRQVICLTTGEFNGRYWPYPAMLGAAASQQFVYPPQGYRDMAAITVSQVMEAVRANVPVALSAQQAVVAL
jgi:ADP-heptose:LPS heptosyltransferase